MSQTKIKAIIIDDEEHCSESLRMLLNEIAPNVALLHTFNSSIQALEYLKMEEPELVFLDIEMPRLNGFDLIKEWQPKSAQIIFTTAYDEFAIRAFRAAAFDYLLKPIDDQELVDCLKRFEKHRQAQNLQLQLNALMQGIADPSLKRLVLPTWEGLELINTDDIVYLESESNYCRIYFENGSTLLLSKTLKEIEELLPGTHFLRIHHSNLIALKKVKKYLKSDGGYVEMITGQKLGVSRTKKNELLERIQQMRF